jgi:membrane protein implicated in regulation of membrane protease activity
VLTAGLGNPVIATGELAGAVGVSLLALVAPWLALAAAILFCVWAWRLVRRWRRRNLSAP